MWLCYLWPLEEPECEKRSGGLSTFPDKVERFSMTLALTLGLTQVVLGHGSNKD